MFTELFRAISAFVWDFERRRLERNCEDFQEAMGLAIVGALNSAGIFAEVVGRSIERGE